MPQSSPEQKHWVGRTHRTHSLGSQRNDPIAKVLLPSSCSCLFLIRPHLLPPTRAAHMPGLNTASVCCQHVLGMWLAINVISFSRFVECLVPLSDRYLVDCSFRHPVYRARDRFGERSTYRTRPATQVEGGVGVAIVQRPMINFFRSRRMRT